MDTEFVRSFNDYYPRLCLLQMAYQGGQCVVDVLDERLDLSPLQEIFDDEGICKVFHDCRQDLDALSQRFLRLPKPIFDTQTASMLCEYHDNSVGYSKLVEQFLGVKLNKLLFKRVDWSHRPLSEGKVRYALDDVTYLHELYGVLLDILVAKGRLTWFREEMAGIAGASVDNYDSLLEGMDFFSELGEAEAIVARSIIEWREKIARLFNVNRNIVMNSKSVLCATQAFLRNRDEEVLYKYVSGSYLDNLPFSLCDILESSSGRKLGVYKLVNHDKPILSALLVLLNSMCKEHAISQKLVASKVELVKLINKIPSNVMRGWRYEFFGCKVEKFIAGETRLIFSVDNSDGQMRLTVDTKSTIT
ncbi:ribonuclease D [Anaplasma centrale]|uniref:ribonuclease D n=1 Tax=Anaplasma centrale TaxID=769 RepID=UPI001EE62908|nr:ribonuclease D [Anaplasma centrale]